jgi:hypothetical protein
MSVRAAFVLGVFLVAAALAHGGIWAAGHDFIVNRFTGVYEFVPADDELGDETETHDVAMSRARPRRSRLDLLRTGG